MQWFSVNSKESMFWQLQRHWHLLYLHNLFFQLAEDWLLLKSSVHSFCFLWAPNSSSNWSGFIFSPFFVESFEVTLTEEGDLGLFLSALCWVVFINPLTQKKPGIHTFTQQLPPCSVISPFEFLVFLPWLFLEFLQLDENYNMGLSVIRNICAWDIHCSLQTLTVFQLSPGNRKML